MATPPKKTLLSHNPIQKLRDFSVDLQDGVKWHFNNLGKERRTLHCTFLFRGPKQACINLCGICLFFTKHGGMSIKPA